MTWHLCPICKLGNPKTDGVDCLDLMAHAANWVTSDPEEDKAD